MVPGCNGVCRDSLRKLRSLTGGYTTPSTPPTAARCGYATPTAVARSLRTTHASTPPGNGRKKAALARRNTRLSQTRFPSCLLPIRDCPAPPGRPRATARGHPSARAGPTYGTASPLANSRARDRCGVGGGGCCSYAGAGECVGRVFRRGGALYLSCFVMRAASYPFFELILLSRPPITDATAHSATNNTHSTTLTLVSSPRPAAHPPSYQSLLVHITAHFLPPSASSTT